jgi:hypothetical protein
MNNSAMNNGTVDYSTEYLVPVDPMDDLQCESCQ